jgi:dTDP-4-dehydrorhamnose reductase
LSVAVAALKHSRGEADPTTAAPIEIWGGIECTITRVGDTFRDQLTDTGHKHRPEDLDAIAELGLRTLRYPVLWEQVAPSDLGCADWEWHDARLRRLSRLRITPIAGLVHHGGGPRYTDLLDPQFPQLLARYAGMVALRYPAVDMFTPVNEPLTTARFSCLYGHWYPHRKETAAFLRALVNECYGTGLAMRAIRQITPKARLIQTEDIGKTFSTPLLRAQAEYENDRRWLSLDLLCGRVDAHHPWFGALLSAGVSEKILRELVEAPCPPDVIGLNYYLTTDRFLDQRRKRYPRSSWGGNGRQDYADVEAVRVARRDISTGSLARLREVWQRYQQPVAVTEVHNGCTREEQLRWLFDGYHGAVQLRSEGADIRAVTVWALIGAVDWDSLLTRRQGHYESGAFHTRGGKHPRPTAIAKAMAALASAGRYDHPVLDAPGWWHRDIRYFRKPRRLAPERKPMAREILVTGATGTLGRALNRICAQRGLDHYVTSRAELDIAVPSSVKAALDRHRPWAVINTAGYVRVADAEREPERCYRENTEGAVALAAACARLGIPLVTFSSDLVFDGRLGRAYVETDPPSPSCVYGASKAEAERRVLEIYPDALVVRTSAFFGPWDQYNFVYHTLSALAAAREVTAGADSIISPTYVPDLVNAALDLLIDGETGIWHLANQGAVSWGELARMAATCGGFDPDRVVLHGTERIPTSRALASVRGEMMPPLASALDRFFKESEVALRSETGRPTR